MLSRHHVVALLHPDLHRVLVIESARGPSLPPVTETWPDHRELVAAVGDPTAFLCAPPTREDDGQVVNVLLAGSTGTPRADGRWIDLDEAARVLPTATVTTIRRAVRDLGDGPPADGRAAWFVPLWRDDVDVWVREQLAAVGARPDGPAEPVKIWSLSAVLRIPACRGGEPVEYWFKATCDGFRDEPTLTRAVRRFAPAATPDVVAVDADRAWMLMIPLPVQEPGPARDWAVQVARTLADMQLASLDHLDDLRAAGLPDRGLDATLTWLDRVVATSVERPLMTREQRRRTEAAAPWLAEQVREFFGLGLPLTLVHGDLHLGNTARGNTGPVLYDWTDACLSHPWFDLRHLATSAGSEVEPEHREIVMDAVRAAYEERWRVACPSADLDRAWELSQVAEAVFTLISYEQIYRAQPEAARWELATVVVDILGRLTALHDGVAGLRQPRDIGDTTTIV